MDVSEVVNAPVTKTPRGGWKSVEPLLGCGRKILTGSEAIARGAIDAGCKLFSSYPITPASNVMNYFFNSKLYAQNGGICDQAEDEISVIGKVIGASCAGGVKSMTATSGPGFSLMQEFIGFAIATETPCVIVNVMRVGPSTGMATGIAAGDVMQARWGHHGDGEIIAICPSSVQECYDLTVKAFSLSEMHRVPVIILVDGFIANHTENLTIPEKIDVFNRLYMPGNQEHFGPTTDGNVPSMPHFGDGEKMSINGTTHDILGNRCVTNEAIANQCIEWLCNKITGHSQTINSYIGIQELVPENATKILVAYGSVSRSALNAITKENEQHKDDPIGFIGLKTLWPFPYHVLEKYSDQCDLFLVPEMNQSGQIAGEIEKIKGRRFVKQFNQTTGNIIYPKEIADFIKGVRS